MKIQNYDKISICCVSIVSSKGSMGDNFCYICNLLKKQYPEGTKIEINAIGASIYKKQLTSIFGKNNLLLVSFNRRQPISFFNINDYIRIYIFLRHINPEIVFFYSAHPINIFILFILFFLIGGRRKKILYWWHDPIPHSSVSINLYKIINKLHDLSMKRLAEKVIVSCDFLKVALVVSSHKNLSRNIFKVELGLLPNLCYDDIKNMKSEKMFDIIFWGRIDKYKGVEVLIDALLLLSDRRRVKAVIIGKGTIKKEYKEKVKCLEKLGILKIINFYVPDRELATYISRSKIAVFPYLDSTGTQTIQVAYYYNVPIICSKVGCFPEYTAYGKAALLIPPNNPKNLADAIEMLLIDNQKRKTLVENGQKLLEIKFCEKNILKRLMDIIL
jgi:glycosyltransferase involved in cell wall biosynthesis